MRLVNALSVVWAGHELRRSSSLSAMLSCNWPFSLAMPFSPAENVGIVCSECMNARSGSQFRHGGQRFPVLWAEGNPDVVWIAVSVCSVGTRW